MKKNQCGGVGSIFPCLLLSLLPNMNTAAVEVSSVCQDMVTESQQQKKITGIVIDKSGTPIIGANILVNTTVH